MKYPFYKNQVVNSISELLFRSADIYGDSVAFKYKKRKTIIEKSYNTVLSDSIKVAKKLLVTYPEVYHIALLGSSSYDWIISYFGVILAGKVVVPLDKELTVDGLLYCLENSDASLLLFDNEYSDIAELLYNEDINNFCSECMSKFVEGDFISEIDLPKVDPDKLSAILFTSGTTGKSKGVMLTQRNFALNVIDGLGAVDLHHGKDVILSILPFHHAYEFTCTILGMLYKGVPICISRGIKNINRELKEYKPTLFFAVPLIAEKLYERILIEAKNNGKYNWFKVAFYLNKFLKLFHIDLSDRLFREVHYAFGGQLRIIMCGGAVLSEKLIKDFKVIGINLFQGYGLTECSPLLCVNFDRYHRPNSVGKIVETCEIQIVDGEIWAKGSTVSSGYYKMPVETSESFENGWFKTGDMGYVDKDGFVFLTGRKKNLIILDNGENVSAEELESLIYNLPYVEETIVYGEKNKIIAEIYIKEDAEIPSINIQKNDINKINKSLPSYKQINCFKFRTEPFLKTTTHKIIRNRKEN